MYEPVLLLSYGRASVPTKPNRFKPCESISGSEVRPSYPPPLPSRGGRVTTRPQGRCDDQDTTGQKVLCDCQSLVSTTASRLVRHCAQGPRLNKKGINGGGMPLTASQPYFFFFPPGVVGGFLKATVVVVRESASRSFLGTLAYI